MYKLPSTAVENDLYFDIYQRLQLIMDNKASMTLTIKTQSGNPLPNIQITNLKDSAGNASTTNENGVASGFVLEGKQKLSINGYADIEDWSKEYTFVKGETYTDNISVSVRNYYQITASKNIKFSSNVQKIDYSVSGAGEPGSTPTSYSSSGGNYRGGRGGKGGNGGQSIISENNTIIPEQLYKITVGGSGGTSSAFNLSALGGAKYTENGRGGEGGTSTSNSPSHATTPTSGTELYYSGYKVKSASGGGGGGGGAYYMDYIAYSSSGASPNGGGGGKTPTSRPASENEISGHNGLMPAGGGGGGSVWGSSSKVQRGNGGGGGSGLVAICMELTIL